MQAIDRIGIVNAVESALNIVDPLKVFIGVMKGTVLYQVHLIMPMPDSQRYH